MISSVSSGRGRIRYTQYNSYRERVDLGTEGAVEEQDLPPSLLIFLSASLSCHVMSDFYEDQTEIKV